MYENDSKGDKKPVSEFEKLLNQLDGALNRQDVIILDIRKRVYTMIEPVKNGPCDCEKEENAGGLIGEIQLRITKVLDHNRELEDINEILLRVVG